MRGTVNVKEYGRGAGGHGEARTERGDRLPCAIRTEFDEVDWLFFFFLRAS